MNAASGSVPASAVGGAVRQRETMRPTEVVEALARRLHGDRTRHLRYLRRRLPSLEDAEDALQDATLKLLRHTVELTTIEKPDSWIATSLRHTVIDRYRRSAALSRLRDALVAEPPAGASPDDPATQTATACLLEALPTLKPEYGTLLRQVYLEDVPLKAAAAQAQLTANTAGVRLHRARDAMRQTLRRLCKTCVQDDCCARERLVASHPVPLTSPRM